MLLWFRQLGKICNPLRSSLNSTRQILLQQIFTLLFSYEGRVGPLIFLERWKRGNPDQYYFLWWTRLKDIRKHALGLGCSHMSLDEHISLIISLSELLRKDERKWSWWTQLLMVNSRLLLSRVSLRAVTSVQRIHNSTKEMHFCIIGDVFIGWMNGN